MPRREELQDEQWALIEPLLRRRRSEGRGRPPCDDRAVRNGILWLLRSGARWKDLPARSPSYPTCHRRFQQWVEDGALSLAKLSGARVQSSWRWQRALVFLTAATGRKPGRRTADPYAVTVNGGVSSVGLTVK